ncbi:MAG: HD-GYP domain-containing protein [bacterium]
MSDFFPLCLRSIVPGSNPGFDLYVKRGKDPKVCGKAVHHPSKNTEKIVLFRAKEKPFTREMAVDLAKDGCEVLYVPRTQQNLVEEYLQQNLSSVAQDKSLPLQHRTEVVYATTTAIMQSVFDEPRASEALRKSQQVIAPIVSLILEEEEAARSLISLTSHDYYTYTHSVNVCLFAIALTEEIFQGVERENLERLGSAFLLHDIGKRNIPNEILNKNGPLNDDEWEIMRRHPQLGCEILEENGYLTDEAEIVVLQHHERFDGSGYPNRLNGDDIHIYSKICCMADVFDALTTKRSYRNPLTSFEALQVMKNEMTGNFEYAFFVAFASLFKSVSPSDPQLEREISVSGEAHKLLPQELE